MAEPVKTRIFRGERIAKTAQLRLGCAAAIFNKDRTKLLLTRRTDNGQWCLPSGGMDAGESVSETAEREVLEETGLVVNVIRLVGIYSCPHMIVEYPDGNRVQVVSVTFEAEVVGGELGLSSETTAVDYFSQQEITALDVLENNSQRIKDAFTFSELPVIS